MAQPLVIAKSGELDLALLPQMANRHGLITGATGTGKTVTLQTLAEHLWASGVPVLLGGGQDDLVGLHEGLREPEGHLVLAADDDPHPPDAIPGPTATGGGSGPARAPTRAD